MKQTKPYYYLIILMITVLSYKQDIGLNMFLITIVSIVYMINARFSGRTRHWWLSAGLWMTSGLALFLSNTQIGLTLYFISGFHFMSVNAAKNRTFPFTFFSALTSFFSGFVRFFMRKRAQGEAESSQQRSQAIIRHFPGLQHPGSDSYSVFLNFTRPPVRISKP